MRSISIVLLTMVSIAATAQSYYSDALLYTRNFVSGTARSAGVAGAFGAVGADLSSVGINPAGLALYRSGDISISPAFSITNNKSDYMGNPTMSPSARFYFGQAGVVWAIPTKVSSSSSGLSFSSPNSLKFVTVALNYSRQSMFNRKVAYSNINSSTSTINAYADYVNATGLGINDYGDDIRLAWETYLLDTLSDGTYYSNVPAPVRQIGEIETRGAKDNIDFAMGFNISDKLYLGAGVGVSVLNYSRSAWYGEDAVGADSASSFTSYTLSSELRIRGMGANFNLGFLYRPAPWVRFGLAYHMPTFYTLNDNYTANMDASFDTAAYQYSAVYDLFKYKYRSPMKGVFSAAFFIKQHAFISVDYEFLNYGGNRFNFGNSYQSTSDAENDYIKNNLNYGHNVRVGVEGAIKMIRLRGGYAMSTSPYKTSYNDQGQSEMRHFATGGVGYRGNNFYADVAYVYSLMNDLSTTQATDYVRNSFKQHQLVITVGFRFGGRANNNRNNNDNYNNYNNNTAPATAPEPVDRSF